VQQNQTGLVYNSKIVVSQENQDAEDRYFASDDTPDNEEKATEDNDQEDELDVFMRHLNQNCSMQEMTQQFRTLSKE
jgi:hypothetical protein